MIYYDKSKKPLTDLSYNIDAPIGTLSWWCFKKIPRGWKLCDGSELDKSQYAKLYSVIGNSFGEASDDSHFRLPDSNGRYLECATLDQIGHKLDSAPNVTGYYGRMNRYHTGNENSGAFYNYSSRSDRGWSGKSGITLSRFVWNMNLSWDANAAGDTTVGEIYSGTKVIPANKKVFIIIKAEDILDTEKLLANVEVVL